MGVITLTSDMGLKDHYVASVKGAILTQFPEAVIFDITHNIEPFDILHASFVLRNCWQDFPAGTVHMVCVDDFSSPKPRFLGAKHKGQFFIASDCGILNLIIREQPDQLVEIAISQESEDAVFVAKDIFAKAAAFLARGGTMEFLGQPTSEMVTRGTLAPTTFEREISGSFVHIDSYGNAISNIDRHLFSLIGKNRPFRIIFSKGEFEITQISNAYNEVPTGEKVALFGGSGFLEIAVNQGTAQTGGGASQLFGIKKGNSITIEFEDVTNR
ncbi:SAM hydrolase/SAM-dependent halogenase family protein [Luteibaculum oceani]|uniref:SAM-dependent chlorinase/fluorinase n=1 Tax=Luteibaculum oceani TaxID=1294296 RepID=A0A5C6V963_9FLAO|nr:SAM-dependent chlorinase/fluorinase [Luteibaculum oceani]TXC81972.1 SAM-dependent chlorinase/fluorinase [Luteibaculum oceani]